jgi:hypothetical protein
MADAQWFFGEFQAAAVRAILIERLSGVRNLWLMFELQLFDR